MKLTIKNIRARAVQAPLKRPPRSASGEIPNAALVLIDITTNEGVTGSSYVFAFMRSMLKPTVAMVEAMAEMINGDAVVPFEIEAKLRKRMTPAGFARHRRSGDRGNRHGGMGRVCQGPGCTAGSRARR